MDSGARGLHVATTQSPARTEGGPGSLSPSGSPFRRLPDLGLGCVPRMTHEFTHRTTMFFHRFRVPTTFTMQTFLGLRDSSFSSSAGKEDL